MVIQIGSSCFWYISPRLKSLTVLILQNKVWCSGWCFLLLLLTCQQLHNAFPCSITLLDLCGSSYCCSYMSEIWLVMYSYAWGVIFVISLQSFYSVLTIVFVTSNTIPSGFFVYWVSEGDRWHFVGKLITSWIQASMICLPSLCYGKMRSKNEQMDMIQGTVRIRTTGCSFLPFLDVCVVFCWCGFLGFVILL